MERAVTLVGSLGTDVSVPRATDQFVGGRGQTATIMYFADESACHQIVDSRNIAPMGSSSMSATISVLEQVTYVIVLKNIQKLEDVFPFVKITSKRGIGKATVYLVTQTPYGPTAASDYSVAVPTAQREFKPIEFRGTGASVGMNFNITDPNNDGLAKEIMAAQNSALTAIHDWVVGQTVVAMRSHSTKYLRDSVTREAIPVHDTLNIVGRLDFPRLGASLSTQYPVQATAGYVYMVASAELISTMAGMLLQHNIVTASRQELGILQHDRLEPYRQLDRVSDPKYMSVNLAGTPLVLCSVVSTHAKEQLVEESYIYEGFVASGSDVARAFEVSDYRGYTQSFGHDSFLRLAKRFGHADNTLVCAVPAGGNFTLFHRGAPAAGEIYDAIHFRHDYDGNAGHTHVGYNGAFIGNMRAKYTNPAAFLLEYADRLISTCARHIGIAPTRFLTSTSSEITAGNLYYYIQLITFILGPRAASMMFNNLQDLAGVTETNQAKVLRREAPAVRLDPPPAPGGDPPRVLVPPIEYVVPEGIENWMMRVNDNFTNTIALDAGGLSQWPPGSIGDAVCMAYAAETLTRGQAMALLLVSYQRFAELSSNIPLPFNFYVARRSRNNVHHALFVEDGTVSVNISASINGSELSPMTGQQSVKFHTHILPLVIGVVVDVPIFVEIRNDVPTTLGEDVDRNVVVAVVADDPLDTNISDDLINVAEKRPIWNAMFGVNDDDEDIPSHVPVQENIDRGGRMYHPKMTVSQNGVVLVERPSKVMAKPFERPVGHIPKSVAYDMAPLATAAIRQS